ncbi:AAR2 protein family [Forsythia ovata]|uniref:AAR2 protein family n=1 Tax=Forsythia ovata TaxID=205694 RepID=A0ABD1P0X9_9LAMI
MDPDTALGLVKHGATLLVLDVPQYTLVGIDTQMFSTGPHFKGIKMIPPGVHFIYYSSSNREGSEFSPIIGFFIDASPSQVIVRKWDQKEEHFVKLCEEEEERYSDAVRRLEFDKNLGPYTLTHYGEWKCLSNYITKNTIQRIEPVGGEITIACESEMVGSIPKTAMEKAMIEQLKNTKFSKPIEKSQKRGCYYTPIPRVVKHKGIHSEDLTIMNLDKTQLLESILTKAYEGDEDSLLGELQFAFIAFLMGQSLEAFIQWKLLIGLLLGCTEAPLHTRSRLFTKFIQVLYYQLKYGFKTDLKDTGTADKGVTALLDESWISDSFLHRLCKDFFSLILEAPVVDGDLLIWTRKLKELLEDSLGWQFNENSAVDGMYFEDDDEYAPVVEMLDDSGTA